MGLISDRLYEKAGHARIPLTGAFELLPVCNLSCKMCYVRKSMAEVQAMGGLLDGKRWLELAEEACACGLLFPLLTGGEPFLHPDFRMIYEGMQRLGMQVSVNSNGTMIDRDTAAWLGSHLPVRINLTLYGASEDTYERLCGNGAAFGRVRDAVQWLKHYGVPVKFNTSITPQNVQDLKAMMDYAKSVGSPIQTATYMFPPIRRDSSMVGKNDRLSPEEAGLARVKADFYQSDPAWFLGLAERFRRFVPLDELKLPENPEQSMNMSCRAGICSFWINWKGNLSNCGMYGSAETPLVGRRFADAWHELVEMTAAVRYAPACTVCPNRPLCHPCIAMVCNECGDNNGRPEYLCRMNQAAAQYYGEYAKLLPEVHQSVNPATVSNCELEEFLKKG